MGDLGRKALDQAYFVDSRKLLGRGEMNTKCSWLGADPSGRRDELPRC